MAGESAKELRGLSVDELGDREKELRQELLNLRFQKATGEIGNTSRIGKAKRELARVLTVLREKRDVRS